MAFLAPVHPIHLAAGRYATTRALVDGNGSQYTADLADARVLAYELAPEGSIGPDTDPDLLAEQLSDVWHPDGYWTMDDAAEAIWAGEPLRSITTDRDAWLLRHAARELVSRLEDEARRAAERSNRRPDVAAVDELDDEADEAD